MSTRELRTLPIMYTRTNRKRKATLDVDLNVALHSVNRDHEGTSSQPLSEGGRATGPRSVSVPAQPIIVDDDADNDVIIASPRAFAEARKNSGRSRGGPIVIIDVDQEEYFSKAASTRWTERRRVPTERQSIIHCDHYINLERESQQKVAPAPPPPPPPPPEPTFSCPICMGPLVEEMSTKCGHIFCKSCIKAAIGVQKKCPTCRKKTTMKDIIRIYLPSSN